MVFAQDCRATRHRRCDARAAPTPRCAGMAPAAPPPRDAEAQHAADGAACAAEAAPLRAPSWLARLCAAACHDADEPPAACEADPPRLARMAAFLAVLLAGYLVAQGAATRGLPSDGRRRFQAGDIGGARRMPRLAGVRAG